MSEETAARTSGTAGTVRIAAPPPASFGRTVRAVQVARPTPEQFDETLALLQAADAAVYGDSDWTESELREDWEGLDLEQDAWLVRVDGRLAGVALGVDAENPTGAVRLYEHAGVRVLWRADVWEKELRAGA